MIIELQNNIVKEGAYGIIIINKDKKNAIKLYKSNLFDNHINISDHKRKQIYRSEIEAYRIVQTNKLLLNYTPKYYGKCELKKVENNGKCISNKFLLNCNFKIEFIEGLNERKLNSINENILIEPETDIKLRDIKQEFNTSGIKYIIDSSVIFDENLFKIIDFATIDPEDI